MPLDSIFADLRARRAKALMPFVCGMHPAPGSTAALLPALERAGASVVEVGYPFSDPIADGPVIAAAMHSALASGATPAGVNAEIAQARRDGCRVGVVAMVSVSIVQRLGASRFIAGAKDAGVDGFIFPDAPLEESGPLLGLARAAGLGASLLVAPTTPPDRAERIARACSGFVYVLARAGITGESRALDVGALSARLRHLRTVTDLPLACGFGISTPEQVRQVVHDAGADAAIVGSALVRRLTDAATAGHDPVAAAESFTRDLATGLS